MCLGPRPMYSCSKRVIPSQMAASISPRVFMESSDATSSPPAKQSIPADSPRDQLRLSGKHNSNPSEELSCLRRVIRIKKGESRGKVGEAICFPRSVPYDTNNYVAAPQKLRASWLHSTTSVMSDD